MARFYKQRKWLVEKLGGVMQPPFAQEPKEKVIKTEHQIVKGE